VFTFTAVAFGGMIPAVACDDVILINLLAVFVVEARE
jgi:hypothetical protein